MAHDLLDAEDLQKVRECLAGNPDAFEVLFNKYRGRIYSLAYRYVQNKEDALEVTQDVFVRAYQALASFQTGSKFYTWLYRIAVNRAIDFVRARRVRPQIEMSEIGDEDLARQSPGPRSPDPAKALDEKELRQKIRSAIGKLSDKHRTVFVLHALENLSYKEIAEVVGCSIGTVMSRLFYARKRLQKELAGYVG